MAEKLLDRNGEPFKIRRLPPKSIIKAQGSKSKTSESVTFDLPLHLPTQRTRSNNKDNVADDAAARLAMRYLDACDKALEDERHVLQSCGCCVNRNLQARIELDKMGAETGYFINQP